VDIGLIIGCEDWMVFVVKSQVLSDVSESVNGDVRMQSEL
jgi:hypothetical protein